MREAENRFDTMSGSGTPVTARLTRLAHNNGPTPESEQAGWPQHGWPAPCGCTAFLQQALAACAWVRVREESGLTHPRINKHTLGA
eukprot:364597-Chlamydomonas_euryale.AAC.8